LLHYLDKLVYPDISANVLTTTAVIVCVLSLVFRARQLLIETRKICGRHGSTWSRNRCPQKQHFLGFNWNRVQRVSGGAPSGLLVSSQLPPCLQYHPLHSHYSSRHDVLSGGLSWNKRATPIYGGEVVYVSAPCGGASPECRSALGIPRQIFSAPGGFLSLDTAPKRTYSRAGTRGTGNGSADHG
jgi:hypothetical protein